MIISSKVNFLAAEGALDKDVDRLLAQGRADNTTNAAVTATVYLTSQTKYL